MSGAWKIKRLKSHQQVTTRVTGSQRRSAEYAWIPSFRSPNIFPGFPSPDWTISPERGTPEILLSDSSLSFDSQVSKMAQSCFQKLRWRHLFSLFAQKKSVQFRWCFRAAAPLFNATETFFCRVSDEFSSQPVRCWWIAAVALTSFPSRCHR